MALNNHSELQRQQINRQQGARLYRYPEVDTAENKEEQDVVQEWRSQTLEAMRRAGAGWHDDDSGRVTVMDTVRSSSWQSAATGSGTDRDSLATTPYGGGSMECTETARRTSVGSRSAPLGSWSDSEGSPGWASSQEQAEDTRHIPVSCKSAPFRRCCGHQVYLARARGSMENIKCFCA